VNPFAVIGLVAAAGVGVTMAMRKGNAAERIVAAYWRNVGLGLGPEEAVAEAYRSVMPGAIVELPSGSFFQTARWIVDRGRPGRDMDMDDAYQGRVDPHWGKDITAAPETPVRAAKTSIVTYAENRIAGFGRMIWLSHLDAGNRSTVYAHLDGFNVGLGQLVQGDDVIGYVGNTCAPEGAVVPCWCRRTDAARCRNAAGENTSRTMGAHCHFEVHNSRIPQMGSLRDNVALGRREVTEPVVWLREEGIAVVGEMV
jgi:hypothetical protein